MPQVYKETDGSNHTKLAKNFKGIILETWNRNFSKIVWSRVVTVLGILPRGCVVVGIHNKVFVDSKAKTKPLARCAKHGEAFLYISIKFKQSCIQKILS